MPKKKSKYKKATKEAIALKKKEIRAELENLKEADPFWFFVPSDGTIDDRGRIFLSKHLKEEDIPQKLDGQLDVLMSQASIVGAGGGNQVGKSTIAAIKGYIKATGELPLSLEGMIEHFTRDIERAKSKFVRGRVIGVDYKQLWNTLIPTWQQWCPKDYLKNGKWKDSFSVQHTTLTLYRNDEPCADIEFMTNQQDTESFQGKPLDWVMYDEEPKESIYKENLMRFTTAGSLDIGFYWTPTQGLTWTSDLFIDNDDDNVELFKLCSVTNKKANLDVLDEIITNLTSYEEKKMRLLGEFISLSGLVYGNLFHKDIHVIEPFEVNRHDHLVLTGLDPHTVTPSAMVFLILDREENVYLDRCWGETADTDEMKSAWHRLVKENGYRMGWAVADKSSNSTIIAFGGRNIFRELSLGEGAIPALRTSEKYEGSIKAGVDVIKQKLKINETTGRPSFFIVNRPENQDLIRSFRTLERDTYANEDVNGPKDRIREGKHHYHAALRYIFQFPLGWWPEIDVVPDFEYQDEAAQW